MVSPGYSSGETAVRVMKSSVQPCPYTRCPTREAVIAFTAALHSVFQLGEAFLGCSSHSGAGKFGAKSLPQSPPSSDHNLTLYG